MKSFITLGAVLAAILGSNTAKADSPNFHLVTVKVDNIQSFTGNIIVPPRVPSGGTPYLWPGLVPPSNQGVLQPVLDGRNQHYYFGNAYVGDPSEPYGGGVDASVNQRLGFYMNNVGSNNWAIGVNNGDNKADYTYNIGLEMSIAYFAVELYPGTNWDFGDLVFEDVTITASGTDSSWCKSDLQSSDVKYSIEGVYPITSDNLVTCKIAKLTLSPP